MFGGGDSEVGVGRISSMSGAGSGGGGGGGQWGQEETRELILIRGELERDFTTAKRNKTLWEIVSARMRDRGYNRTPDQCKCKWKNLLNRYKVLSPFFLSLNFLISSLYLKFLLNCNISRIQTLKTFVIFS